MKESDLRYARKVFASFIWNKIYISHYKKITTQNDQYQYGPYKKPPTLATIHVTTAKPTKIHITRLIDNHDIRTQK
jgi:hypothetical protein